MKDVAKQMQKVKLQNEKMHHSNTSLKEELAKSQHKVNELQMTLDRVNKNLTDF